MSFNLPKLILVSALLLLLSAPVLAGLNEDLAANKSEQDRLQRLIDSAKNQENTLSSQIATFNNQIRLTQLQIDSKQAELNSKEAELAGLNTDIGALTGRIGNLETNLNDVVKIATKRFRVSQAVENAAPLETSFIGGDFQTASSNLTYLEYIQRKDKQIFSEMSALKSGLSVQKSTLQDRQAQVQKLRDTIRSNRDDLASSRSQLDSQKAAKVSLLKLTQNNEANYKRLLDAAKREAAQIAAAYNNKGGSRWVRKGEIIGSEGNTGYSTGTHLHFGVHPSPYNYYNNVNPCGFISCDYRGDEGFVRNGRYRVPIQWDGVDYANVSQWYGMTYWARSGAYGGGPHTGVDMYTYNGDSVYAAEDGQAYFYRGGQSNGNGVFIYHADGMVTLYWHLN